MDKAFLSNYFHFHAKVSVFVPLPLLFLTSSLASPLLAFQICFSRPLEVNLPCSHEHPSQGGLGIVTANLLSADQDRTQGNGLKLHWVEGWGWKEQLDQTFKKGFLPRGWFGTQTGSPGKRLQLRGCQSSRNRWTTLSGAWCES